jgi:hypothetical protein
LLADAWVRHRRRDRVETAHASVAFTLDTYAHVKPGQQRDAALAAAALLDANANRW